MQAVTITQITPPELTVLIRESVKDELNRTPAPSKPDELLTRAQVAEMLDVDLSTLHLWAKRGKLIPVGIGNRVYYRRSDIEAALVPLNT
jgi:hypothetical protein